MKNEETVFTGSNSKLIGICHKMNLLGNNQPKKTIYPMYFKCFIVVYMIQEILEINLEFLCYCRELKLLHLYLF